MSNIQTKFRPSLTITQIERIISTLNPAIDSEILAQLNKFRLKAVHGIATPSHIAMTKQSLEDSLGFGESKYPATSTAQNQDTAEQLLEIYKQSPNSLSPAQMKIVNHHRYVNDLMTPEEESVYEASN